MKIGFVQYSISNNRNHNIKTVKKLLSNLNANIIILPELSDCGYLFADRAQLQAASKSLKENDFIDELKLISIQKQCAIIAGVAERCENKVYNSAIIIDNGYTVGVYRKIHLTDFEKTLFDRGEYNPIFSVQGIKIGVQICFDLWFPEISREQILQGAEVLCVLANFGGETTYDIAKIRAIENLTPLILCNRVGEEKNDAINATFLGRSTIIDNSGNKIAIGSDYIEDVKVCMIKLPNEKSNVICKNFISEISYHYTK